MSDGTLVPLGAVKRAIARLEAEHCYGFPEFWDYLDEEIEAEGRITEVTE